MNDCRRLLKSRIASSIILDGWQMKAVHTGIDYKIFQKDSLCRVILLCIVPVILSSKYPLKQNFEWYGKERSFINWSFRGKNTCWLHEIYSVFFNLILVLWKRIISNIFFFLGIRDQVTFLCHFNWMMPHLNCLNHLVILSIWTTVQMSTSMLTQLAIAQISNIKISKSKKKSASMIFLK